MANDEGDLSGMLDHILEGLQILGPDFRYLHVNDAAARHGKTTKQALLGRTLPECYPGVEHTALFTVLKRCLTERRSQVMENEFRFPDGSLGWFELRIEPVPQGICVLSIDVTAKKLAERARQEAEERLRVVERADSAGSVAANIAHEFDNLLTVVLSRLEMVRTRTDGLKVDDLAVIEAAAHRAAALTQRLTACGRRSVFARQPVDLVALLRWLEPQLRAQLRPEIAFELLLPVAPLVADIDRSSIERVVHELVGNARDAIVGAGTVTVALAHVPARSRDGRGDCAMITVRDDGQGMDEATRARVFEPYFTARHGRRAGLGLASAQGVVRQHGGMIAVRSQRGRGSTFDVVLPLAAGEAPPAPAVPTTGDRYATVLVVESDPLVAAIVTDALRGDGHEVVAVADGAGALAAWVSNGDNITLLITDVRLPDFSGPELAQRLRRERPDLRVLCTSGYDVKEFVAGVDPRSLAFLAKPFTPSALIAQVRALLAPV